MWTVTFLVGFSRPNGLPHAWIMMLEIKSLCGPFGYMYMPCCSVISVFLSEAHLWSHLFWDDRCSLSTSFIGICDLLLWYAIVCTYLGIGPEWLDRYISMHIYPNRPYTLCLIINAMSNCSPLVWPHESCPTMYAMLGHMCHFLLCIMLGHIHHVQSCAMSGHMWNVPPCTMFCHMCHVRPCTISCHMRHV